MQQVANRLTPARSSPAGPPGETRCRSGEIDGRAARKTGIALATRQREGWPPHWRPTAAMARPQDGSM